MSDADNLTDRGFALAQEGEVYVVYLPDGGSPKVDLPGTGGYQVLWGGDLQDGSVAGEVTAGNAVSLGEPPTDTASEWVVLARRSNSIPGNISPNISITSPSNAQQFEIGDTVTIEAAASDPDGSITSVAFFVDGQQIGSDELASPYQTTFDTATPGTLSIQATATDNLGSARTASLTVTVNTPIVLRDPGVPANEVTTGLNYQYFEIVGENNLNVLDDLTDPPTSVGSQADGLSFAPRTNNNQNFGFIFNGYISVPTDGEYSFFLNSNDGSEIKIGETIVVNNDGQHTDQVQVAGSIGLKAGLHAFQLRYFQSGGTFSLIPRWEGPDTSKDLIPASAFSYQTTTPINVPPTVSLEVPNGGDSVPIDSEVTLQAQANDDGAIVNVEFFVDNASVGIDTTGSPYTVSWTPTSDGDYNVFARAKDDLGVTTDSAVIEVTVTSSDGEPSATDDSSQLLCVPVKTSSGTVSLICL